MGTNQKGRKNFWQEPVTIYLYHFDGSLAHAQHYLGSAIDYSARGVEHASGDGSALMAAVVGAGISYRLARRWENVPRYHEVTLHRRKANKQLCPVCSGEAARARGQFTPSPKPEPEQRKRRIKQ